MSCQNKKVKLLKENVLDFIIARILTLFHLKLLLWLF